MAFAGSVKKPSRVVRTLKLMKSRFLSKPESQILFSRRTKLLFETSKGTGLTTHKVRKSLCLQKIPPVSVLFHDH